MEVLYSNKKRILNFDGLKKNYCYMKKNGKLYYKIDNEGVSEIYKDTLVLSVGIYCIMFNKNKWNEYNIISIFSGLKGDNLYYLGDMGLTYQGFKFLNCSQDLSYKNNCNNLYQLSGSNIFIADMINDALLNFIQVQEA